MATGRAGFTLIEMLVALAILGLATAVVAGFLPRNHATLDLTAAADGLADTLRGASARAMARQVPVMFTASADGHGYALDGATAQLPPDVTILLPAPIRFAPDGSASGGEARLAAGSRMRVLRVDWLTGQVSVADAR